MTPNAAAPKRKGGKRADRSQWAAIAGRIREAMAEAGFEKDVDLAEAAGVNPGNLNRILQGNAGLGGTDTAQKLARALRVRVEWLREGSWPKREDSGPVLPGFREIGERLGYATAEVELASKLVERLPGVVSLPEPKVTELLMRARIALGDAARLVRDQLPIEAAAQGIATRQGDSIPPSPSSAIPPSPSSPKRRRAPR